MLKEKTVHELKQMMDEGADFQLIDVREPHEFELANIGGEPIPMGKIRYEEEKIAPDKPVVATGASFTAFTINTNNPESDNPSSSETFTSIVISPLKLDSGDTVSVDP